MRTIFVSYASEDAAWKTRVLGELEPLLARGQLRIWQDDRIASGARWKDEVFRHLNQADAFLVLASEFYVGKDFVRAEEFPRIRERVEQGRAHLFWLPLDDYAVSGGRDPDGVLDFLEVHQAAHRTKVSLSELNDRSARGTPQLQDALIRVSSGIKSWLRSDGESGRVAPRKPAPLVEEPDAEQLERLERSYLRDLVRAVRYLPLSALGRPGGEGTPLRQLPLEQTYVTLRADPTTLADRLETRALHQELAGLVDLDHYLIEEALLGGAHSLVEEKQGSAVDQILAERGDRMPPAAQADAERPDDELIVEQAFQLERVLVILGDPGSGKSVLCRWLALHLATALEPAAHRRRPRSDDGPALGPPRLPILIRVAELNPWLQSHVERRGRGAVPDLLDALEFHARLLQEQEVCDLKAPEIARVLHEAVAANRAVLLVDGLDEIPDAEDRELVSEMIEDFAAAHVIGSRRGSFVKQLSLDGSPGETGGNQVVVTSRITGYHLAPLRFDTELAAHYLIRPLDDARVQSFCRHVAQVLDDYYPEDGLGQRLLEDLRGNRLAGVDRLKRNPLLLTSLISYWYRQRRFPESRAELYHAILLDLCARWRSMESIMRRFSDELRRYLEDDDKLLDLLGMIAGEIHLHHPSGRIGRGVFEQIVHVRLLPTITGKQPLELEDSELRRFEDDTPSLVALLSTQVGALTEVGSNVFSFLHLTFQEYLVGRKLVRSLGDEDPEADLVTEFLDQLHEARWREPMLFAFGEIGRSADASSTPFDRRRFLRELHERGFRGQAAFAAELPLLQADLLMELPPDGVEEAEVREVLRALAEGYSEARGSRSRSRKQRERIAERVAELRRGSVAGTGQRTIDDLVCTLMVEDHRLAPALADLYWRRLWLTPRMLDTMAACLHLDAPEWEWPMHSALRWCLLAPEERLTVDPIDELKLPAPGEGNVDAVRSRRRYETAIETWEWVQRARQERVTDPELPAARFPTRSFFLERPRRWENLLADPSSRRAVTALLSPVADHHAADWRSEYVELARFLQGGDGARQQEIDREPETFVVRWGLDDPVYNCAVYLDSNPGGRFTLLETKEVELDPELIASRLSPRVGELLRRSSESQAEASALTERLTGLIESERAEERAEAVAALAAVGSEIDPVLLEADECRRALRRTGWALEDAALRGLRQRASGWLVGQGGKLTDAEGAALYRHWTQAVVEAAGFPIFLGGPSAREPAFGRLHTAVRAERWARSIVGTADDPVYDLAVCLDTLGPKAEGWPSLLPLLGSICCSGNAVLLRDQALLPSLPPLWGVSPEERILPPQAFDALLRLAALAARHRAMLGAGFLEVFLEHLPSAGVEAHLRDWILGPHQRWAEYETSGASRRETPPEPPPTRGIGELDPSELESVTDPFECALRIEAGLHGSHRAFFLPGLIRDTVEELARASGTDAVLFSARMARQAPDADLSHTLLEKALDLAEDVEETGDRAELLARLAPRVAWAPELVSRLSAAAGRLGSHLLRSYVSGDLGRFLGSAEFVWNDPESLGLDPEWTAVSTYLAVRGAHRDRRAEVDTDELWRSLATSPDPGNVDRLLASASPGGLPCSRVALETLETLREAPRETVGSAHLQRAISLLSGPRSADRPELERWLAGSREEPSGGEDSPLGGALAWQAAILLAELDQDLRVEWIDPLFEAVAEGDDFQAVRAELALAGPIRAADRKQRRFTTSHADIETLKYLGRVKAAHLEQSHGGYLAEIALGALNDWVVDSPESLEAWLSEATPGSDAETTLLEVLGSCDCWSPDCQNLVAEWLLERPGGASGARRESALLGWVARMTYIDATRPEPGLFERLDTPVVPDPESWQAFPRDSQSGSPLRYLVAEVCFEAASQVVGAGVVEVAEESLRAHLRPLYPSGRLDRHALKDFGGQFYYKFADRPEFLLQDVAPYLDRPPFRRALTEWSLAALERWRLREKGKRKPDPGVRILQIELEVLLSSLVCLSDRSESSFARLCEPDRFLEPLASICLDPPSRVAQMAAITLISKLKHVDLDLPVRGEGETTVLDALLGGLRRGTSVRERLAETLPRIYRLRGRQVVDRLRVLLTGEAADGSAATRLHAGSEVLAAANLLLQMIQRGTLRESKERRAAFDVLREAADSPRNRRPLYVRVGYGAGQDPIGAQRVGDLAEELRHLVGSQV